MGRLSDARKKAKGGTTAVAGGKGSEAEVTTPSAAGESASAPALEPTTETASEPTLAPSIAPAAAPKKSAKSGGKNRGFSTPPGDGPAGEASSEPISFAAEGRKSATSAQLEAAQRLADELLAGIEADDVETDSATPSAPSMPGRLGSSGLAEDVLAPGTAMDAPVPKASAADALVIVEDESDIVEPGSSTSDSGGLPSSGLAEDLLAEMERRAAAKKKPSESQSDEFMSAWPVDNSLPKRDLSNDDFKMAHQLGDDVLALMGSEPAPKKARGPTALPSSGLADDILSDMPRPVAKSPLGVDDVHEFEAFFEEERAAEQLQLVLFQMETELFALEIDRVQEIIRVPAITRVPHSLDAVRGVCNLRGRIVPVLDLRKLMRLVPKSIDRFNRIMVLDVAGKRIGVLIDRVSEVARINVPDVEPPPEELRAVDANLVTAVARQGERMIFILDVDRVLALK